MNIPLLGAPRTRTPPDAVPEAPALPRPLTPRAPLADPFESNQFPESIEDVLNEVNMRWPRSRFAGPTVLSCFVRVCRRSTRLSAPLTGAAPCWPSAARESPRAPRCAVRRGRATKFARPAQPRGAACEWGGGGGGGGES